MKKVLYVLTSPAHKRVFESFVERPDLDQLVVGPPPTKSKMVPEDYSDFKLKNIQYGSIKNISGIVGKFKPDIYVQAELINQHNVIQKNSGLSYKRVFVSHGMAGNNIISIAKPSGLNLSVFRGLDLYCGANKTFADWMKYAINVDDSKILLNALPQLDILFDSNYYTSYRDAILAKTKFPAAKKVILFLGFCCKDRHDFKPHNEDYFRTAIELGRMAKENNWLVMIKPRQTHSEMMDFLKNHGWSKYMKDYESLHANDNVHFIGPAGAHIYRYYFADAFVINGCSTAEIEACAIQKPLFVVRTNLKCLQSGYDPFSTTSSGAAMSIPDLSELEHDLLECFNNNKYHWPDKQKKLLEDMGISFDGKHHERIQNSLARL